MKIAVIGSGFFGSIISLVLSKSHKVHLFEKEKDILNGASKINQFRFHLGFHYPRSPDTIREIKSSEKLFKKFFPKNIFGKTQNYYAVANKDSKISFNRYIEILKKYKLKYKIKKNTQFNKISDLILTKEKILNYFTFKNILKKKILASNVELFLNKEFNKKNIPLYDKIIVCTYSQNNKILNEMGLKKNNSKYRYELIEKILVKLPTYYKNKSFIVMDGQFVCIDPYLGTKYHLLSDVKFSKIEVVNKKFTNFKSTKFRYVNNKLNKNIKISNFKKFINHGSQYLPFLLKAKYVGSFFIIRTLRQNVEKTDERMGEIQFLNKKFISIFSSKWNTSVHIANKLYKMLRLDHD
jgi:D-amino-acid oxidase|tara:strand:- start:968 stop:2023 length:1056 start_codon:yes stop_codon:yes gene_type:complete